MHLGHVIVYRHNTYECTISKSGFGRGMEVLNWRSQEPHQNRIMHQWGFQYKHAGIDVTYISEASRLESYVPHVET